MKKVISLLISVVLFTTMLTAASFAATVNIPSDASVYNGHRYKIYSDSKTWTEAKSFCENLGGHLLTINSASEQEFVENFLLPFETTKAYHWIGLYDDGTNKNWKWVTGEPTNYTNWASGEPSDAFQDKTVILSNGKWMDNPNEGYIAPWTLDDTGFICEWDATSYTATFKDNSGTKTVSGTKITTPSISSKSGWTSTGWTTTAGVPASVTVAANTSYTLTASKTFYALYKKDLTLTYNANGGKSAPSSQKQTIYYNSCGLTQTAIFSLSKSIPTRDGYKFLGWSTDKNAVTASYNAGQKVEMNESSATTLYAVWQKNQNTEINVELNYKSTFKVTMDSFKATEYISDNSGVASVSADGTITGTGKGSTAVHAFDSAGNETVIHVTVNYAWWQWIIVIVLFGWIWY